MRPRLLDGPRSDQAGAARCCPASVALCLIRCCWYSTNAPTSGTASALPRSNGIPKSALGCFCGLSDSEVESFDIDNSGAACANWAAGNTSAADDTRATGAVAQHKVRQSRLNRIATRGVCLAYCLRIVISSAVALTVNLIVRREIKHYACW